MKTELRRAQNRESEKRRRALRVHRLLTHDALLGCLKYDPSTGVWIWLVQTKRAQTKIGDIAGRINKTHGRLEIGIFGRRYAASRLAWFYMTGEWPVVEVDHHDTDPLNNKWNNLRLATRGQNEANKGITSRNTSGLKGASWDNDRNCWKSQISHSGQHYFLGRYLTKEEAHAVYVKKCVELFGGFARTA